MTVTSFNTRTVIGVLRPGSRFNDSGSWEYLNEVVLERNQGSVMLSKHQAYLDDSLQVSTDATVLAFSDSFLQEAEKYGFILPSPELGAVRALVPEKPAPGFVFSEWWRYCVITKKRLGKPSESFLQPTVHNTSGQPAFNSFGA